MHVRQGVNLRPVTPQGAALLAHLHAASFPEGAWDEAAFNQLLAMRGMAGELLSIDDTAAGSLLHNTQLQQTDIVTLAVLPAHRRQGYARLLLERTLAWGRGVGITQFFLEVAVDNTAALALYRRCAFQEQRLRRAYYQRKGLPPVDALAMVLTL